MVTKAEVLAEITTRPSRKITDISHRLVTGDEPELVGGQREPDYPADSEVKSHIRRLVAEGVIYATGHGYELV